MPTPMTHAFVGLSAGAAVFGRRMPRRFWAAAVVCAALADVDIVGLRMGVPYGSVLGHRGLMHGLPFAVVASLAATWLVLPDARVLSKRWWGTWAFLLAVASSHGLLDAMTNGGLGVALFSPFSNARYFLPWRPIEVSPIGLGRLLSRRGAAVIRSELLWVWLPGLGASLLAAGFRKARPGGRKRRVRRGKKIGNRLPARGPGANNR